VRRRLGAALGVSVGPMAGWGQLSSGTGDGHAAVWLLGAAVGAFVGALALPLFFEDDAALERGMTPVFGGLFLFSVGLLAGSFVAFPMGAVAASVVGAGAGALGTLLFRRLGGTRLDRGVSRDLLTAASTTGLGLLGAMGWLS
jgi:glucose uptake protein GlcU